MIYEIVNPSDAVTVEAESDDVARAAVLILGEGRYGLTNEQDVTVLPLLLFGGAVEYLEETFGNFSEWMEAHLGEVAGCLDTVMTVGRHERLTFNVAMKNLPSDEERAAFRAEVHDRNRTSMNDIAGRAWRIAAAMREKAAKERGEG